MSEDDELFDAACATPPEDARSESTRKSHWEWFQNALWTFLEQLDGGWPNQISYAVFNFPIILSVASPIVATTHILEFHFRTCDEADLVSEHLRILDEWVHTHELCCRLCRMALLMG